jgi:hypothetical protein
LITDKRVGHFAEGALNDLLIRDQSLPVFRLSQLQVSGKCAGREDRLSNLRAVRPDAELRGHKAAERGTAAKSAAAGTGERNLREKLRLSDADFGVGGDEVLLGFANIGSAFNE